MPCSLNATFYGLVFLNLRVTTQLGREGILRRSAKNSIIKIFTANTHYFHMPYYKQLFFVTVNTCSGIVEISAWPSCYRKFTYHWIAELSYSQRKIIEIAKQIYRFFSAKIMVRLPKFPQFKEYFAKQGTYQIYSIMKNKSRYRNHERALRTELRLK